MPGERCVQGAGSSHTFHLVHFAGGEVDGDDVVVVGGGEDQQVPVTAGREEGHVTDARGHRHLIGCLQGAWGKTTQYTWSDRSTSQ